MSDKIDRYILTADVSGCEMDEHAEGDWVDYDDHVKALAELQKINEHLITQAKINTRFADINSRKLAELQNRDNSGLAKFLAAAIFNGVGNRTEVKFIFANGIDFDTRSTDGIAKDMLEELLTDRINNYFKGEL